MKTLGFFTKNLFLLQQVLICGIYILFQYPYLSRLVNLSDFAFSLSIFKLNLKRLHQVFIYGTYILL